MRTRKRIVLYTGITAIALLTVVVSAQTGSRATHPEIRFPVAGSPPLTQQMVQNATTFFEWLLDASLTVEQRQQFQNSLAQSWLSRRQEEIQATVNVLQFADQINRKTPQEREVYRQVLQPKFLAEMGNQRNSVLSSWVLNIYDSAHKSIAAGNPPLTQQVVDSYAEAVSFMLEQSTGKGFSADRTFKDALTHSLVVRYPQLSADEQMSMARIPLQWALIQAKWPRIPVTEQRKLSDQWRSALQPLLKEVNAASSGDSSNQAPLDQQLQKEVQKSWVNSLSQSYMTRTTNILLSHRPF